MAENKRFSPVSGAKIVRMLCNVMIIIFLLGFVLALRWYIGGSFEMSATEEQQEKARIGAVLSMIATGLPCILCVCVRGRYKKSENH